jgi:hypothetical protein
VSNNSSGVSPELSKKRQKSLSVKKREDRQKLRCLISS